MHEVQAVERVLRVVDAPVQVHAAAGAGVAADGGGRVHHLQLVAVGGDFDLVAADHAFLLEGEVFSPELAEAHTRYVAARAELDRQLNRPLAPGVAVGVVHDHVVRDLAAEGPHGPIPLRLYRPDAFTDHVAQLNAVHGIYIGIMFAMSLVSLIPILLFFLFAQKHIIKGIAASGLKE